MKVILIALHGLLGSIGVRSLSSSLKQGGHDPQIVFLIKGKHKFVNENVLDQIIELSKDAGLVGISLMTPGLKRAAHITRKLRKSLDVPVIWGGVHPTMHPMECLEYTEMICIGEGEEALTELAHKIENREDVYTTSNIWFKHDTQIIKNKPRPLIQNLESTIHIDCNFTDHYVESNRQIKKITEALLEKGTANEYLVHATRGCPNRCTYCTNSKLNEIYPEGAKIRKRLNGAVEELIEIKKGCRA